MQVSVVVVSDYQAGSERSWDDERRCFRALARQDTRASVEYLLCLDESLRDSVPQDLMAILSGVRILFVDSTDSYVQKNHGVRCATAPLVALLDADCQPSPNWLRCSLETLERRPEVAAVSGRTVYPSAISSARIFALLGRSYLDPGGSGATQFIANNGSVIRREVYLAHPLPEDLGPFSARIQSQAVLGDGHMLWFDAGIEIEHEYAGWNMEVDIRRHLGWCTIATRLKDASLPYAALIRVGVAALPLVWFGKLINIWRDAIRCFRAYGVRAYEMPYVLVLGTVLSFVEIPGMWRAWMRQPLRGSAYR